MLLATSLLFGQPIHTIVDLNVSLIVDNLANFNPLSVAQGRDDESSIVEENDIASAGILVPKEHQRASIPNPARAVGDARWLPALVGLYVRLG